MQYWCRVLSGTRPERPESCPGAVFKLMERCWAQSATDRPTSAALKMDIQDAYAADIAAQAVQELDVQNLCVVCLEGPAEFALLPCGHKCVCEEHAAVVCVQGKCPLCCMPVRAYNKIW